jgi:hypothetical protein
MAYRTTDLNVSAFLLATGHQLVGLEGTGQQKMFLFHDGARDDVPKYFMGAKVTAREFAQALKTLKSALHTPG